MAAADLTVARLRELLHYDPDTGLFTRLGKRRRLSRSGGVGCISAYGYLLISVDGRLYLAHRLAWLYVTGSWPANSLDHRDRDKLNNRFANLRDVRHLENQHNVSNANKTSRSGLRGVSPSKGKWTASITANGKQEFLGRYDTPEEAHAVYKAARQRLHLGALP